MSADNFDSNVVYSHLTKGHGKDDINFKFMGKCFLKERKIIPACRNKEPKYMN